MALSPLVDHIDDRVALDKDEGDIAYFNALSLKLEYITKVVTAGVIACIGDDADRHRYSLEHRLVRANAIGDWADVLNTALTGPAAQFFDPDARPITRDLTERIVEGDWRYSALSSLHEAAQALGVDTELGPKAALRQFFEMGARIRNRTRGHGATTSLQCSNACPFLAEAIKSLVNQLQLFNLPWVYLHRNLSGKYRVSTLLGDASPFDYLKKTRDVRLPNGVYLHLNRPVYVPMVLSDQDMRDVLLPNGNYRAETYEVLSYVTNDTARRDGAEWSAPPERLPPSETEGAAELDLVGNVFTNLPSPLAGYISRTSIESELREELLTKDRHPVVSLTGPGGIGKTSIAIAAIQGLVNLDPPPYEVILWISARDIDLLETGPKPVAPCVVTKKDIARAAAELLDPQQRSNRDFHAEEYFQSCLAKGASGPTLFVLDNFETVESPGDVFKWIDTHVRPPNKVLITTRSRDFAGDYPIEIGGMKDEEASALVDQESLRLGIVQLIERSYRENLIRESDGHPYVMKILLGRVAAERRAVKPERIVATSDHLLRALFERTYADLTPASQRVFLLLCSWRVFVPEVALEAVLLRPGNERFDVAGALDELRRFSLVDQVATDREEDAFIGVPLAAAMYGRRKLEASPFKITVDDDRKLLMEFGAGKRDAVHRGVLPRIENHMRAVAMRATEPAELEKALPVLEYLAARFPPAYLQLAELVMEVGESTTASDQAKRYLRSFLENAALPDRQGAWTRLASLCYTTGDVVGEVHALSEAALLPSASPEDMGRHARFINDRLRELKGDRIEDAWSPEVRSLIEKVIAAMEKRISELSAMSCSRLAWLHLNVGNEDRARDVAKIGIQRDPTNEHCQRLLRRLGK